MLSACSAMRVEEKESLIAGGFRIEEQRTRVDGGEEGLRWMIKTDRCWC